MPLFEYHCPDCQHDFDELRKHSERDDTIICPNCKSRRPERKVSLFSSAGGSSGGGCSSYGGKFT